MGKSHWIFVAVAVLAAGACTQDFDEFFRGKAAPGGSGGTAGTGGSGGSGGTGGAVGGGGGAGGCESPSDCPGSDTTCRYRTCEQGQCGTEDAPLGTPCTEQGGELCDGNGNCVTAECTDNVKNGNETDVDCGGDSCPPCANGLECNVYGDCESRFCDTGGGGGSGGGTAGTCAPCGGDPDCLPVPSSWCDSSDDGGTCADQKVQGSTCGGDSECVSGECTDGYCCDVACGGNCEACNLSGSEGTCTNHPPGTDPEGGCAPDVCGVGGVCRCADGQTNGSETDQDCGGGACPTCPDGDACNVGTDCTSGNCPGQDGLCCDTPCDTQCEACLASKTGGTDGQCGAVTGGQDPDGECADAPGNCGPNGTGCNGSGSDPHCAGSPCGCAEQYTHSSILEQCAETATECTLRVNTFSGSSCDDICADGGGECVAYYNDSPSGTCGIGSQSTCSATNYTSAICICSRGCGGDAACASPFVCSGGDCS